LKLQSKKQKFKPVQLLNQLLRLFQRHQFLPLHLLDLLRLLLMLQ
jgi:hypothetical protein